VGVELHPEGDRQPIGDDPQVHLAMRDPAPGLNNGFSMSQEAWRGVACALGLARREVEVLECVVADQHEKDIATTLGVSRHTVRTYLKRLRAKAGASSRVQLVKRVFAEYSAWVARSTPS